MYVSKNPGGQCLKCRQTVVPLRVLDEHLDRQDWVVACEAECPLCGSHSLYKRRPTPAEEEQMGKKKRAVRRMDKKLTTPSRPARRGRQRVVAAATATVKQHRRATGVNATPPPMAEGPITLPAPEEAVQILGVLAELNDEAVRCHALYATSREETKEFKEAWEEAVKAVQDRLRRVTHPDLPLFDGVEREQDQQRMEEAAADPLLPTLDLEGPADAPLAD